ncbi:MAG: helix-turn-helix transcriptional regulator, partial [Firmicutes bacterium]|nr:helix-turn-helix transcriptional regulator [Bacillota bacterium]
TTRAFLSEKPGFQFTCVGYVSLMLAQLLETVPYVLIDDQEYAARKRKTARIRRITDYIDQHYKEKIMLPDLAKMEGITTTYLSHFFHDTFHMTFQEYLNRLRLEKALILMKDPSLYLVDICMECGFSDNKYLNQMFMKKFGCSASEYRKKRIEPDLAEVGGQTPASYSQFHYRQDDALAILEKYLETFPLPFDGAGKI